jgi:F0F1-type ATP synthase assembly protein I
MPTEYDANILQSYADDLYRQAQNIITSTAAKYGLVMFLVSGVLVGVLFASMSHQSLSDIPGGTAIVIIIIFTGLGIAVG